MKVRSHLLMLLITMAAVVLLGLDSQLAHAAKGGGGGAGIVSVTAAEPASANQGEALDVYITGDGFDNGSTATFFVAGTEDASQITVDSTTYEESTGKLKASIRVNGAALVTDYDIEVRNSRGRRGKGTTLFKVRSVETACTGFEPKEPVIAYLTALKPDGDYETQDLYLSSASGCDQYLLLEDAVVKVPGDIVNSQHEPGAYLVGVRGLRLDIQDDLGVITWRDAEVEIDRLYSLQFYVSPTGIVTVDPAGPEVIYLAPSGAEVQRADVRFNVDGEIELLVLDAYRSGSQVTERQLVYLNTGSLESATLMAGNCPVLDSSSTCYVPDPFRVWWNEDGAEAYLNLYWEGGGTAIGRVARVAGEWQPAEVLMTHPFQVTVIGIRSDGLLAYEHLERQYHRNGRLKSSYWLASSIDPDLCATSECAPGDGTVMAADANKFLSNWTRNGGLLFTETGPGSQLNIREYSNPFTGAVGSLEIQDVDFYERDTTF